MSTASAISRARLRAGMSQQVLADRMGLSRSAVAAMEAGQRALKAEELARLAEIFGLSMAFFLPAERRPVDFEPLYRLYTAEEGGRVAESPTAYGRATAEARTALDTFRDRVQDWVDLLEVAGREAPAMAQPPAAAPGQPIAPRALAEWARSHGGLGPTAAIHDLRRFLEEELGIQVFVLPWNQTALSGASLHAGAGGACAMVARGLHQHMRFTLAHEAGHLLAHPGQAHALGTLERHGEIRSQETYANQFAADLLMPAEGIRERVSAEPELASHRAIQRLAWHFDVSFRAMAVRLESMRFLKRGWYEQELERMRADGRHPAQAVEPADVLDVSLGGDGDWEELPIAFRRLCLEMLDEGRISMGKFAEWMGPDWDLDRADWTLRRFRAQQVAEE